MTYNKKQMQPLINKYGINPETNKLFIKTCEMFDGQPNYQIWAVRIIFSQAANFEEIKKIHDWVINNSSMINKLAKQNIVSYSTKSGIVQLSKEIVGIDRITFIKNIISRFNTAQKKILTESILGENCTPLEAYNSSNVKKWYDVLVSFNKKPMSIKNKFYSTCSALNSAASLHQAILDCLKTDYNWKEGKEDLIAYMSHNAKDCEIVFNEGPCLIVQVPSFDSSHKLCGNGHTGWCISREESYFKTYVTNYSNRAQYFLFDFSRKETDAFAHIGFTVENGNGIVEAQTSHNYPMIQPYTQGKESLSIYDVFKNFGINMNIFMRLPKELGFEWDIAYMLNLVKNKPESYALAYNDNGRLIINVLTNRAFQELVGKTYIKARDFQINDTKDDSIYLLMDLNLPINNDKSLIAMKFQKDKYKSTKLTAMEDIFGGNIINDNYLSKIGLSIDDFIGHEAIDPSILLHKLIDENDEIGAINLIEKEGGNINVNYEFNQKVPIYAAIYNNMFNLFDAIVKCKSFKCDMLNGFGEPILQSLIYLNGSEDVASNKEDLVALNRMIKSILSSKTYDYNSTDLNNDTALISACEFQSEAWVAKILVSNKNVDVNVVNDFDFAAIDNCIVNKNFDALKALGQRPDLKIRQKTIDLAKQFGINLEDYIKPTKSIYGKYIVEHEMDKTEDVLEYELASAC